ncbi:MAG TPA: hypothetical protein VG204_14030 [Terriglobia bacterium]|nr:hypothetical protein [Terriglobia bacterium]
MSVAPSSGWKRTTLALLLFGISFGYVEAAVVVYLRVLNEPLRQQFHLERGPDDLFPVVTLDQLKAVSPDTLRLLKTEVAREAATLVMLGTVALCLCANLRQWVASFVILFGVWDIAFYAFLRLLIGWPRSVLTWDLLYLIPVPWVGPVLAPVLVSLSMIGAGFVVLVREWTGKPVHLGPVNWLGIVAGGLIIVLAFTWDHRNIMAGGMPNPFNWPMFIGGEAVGLGGFFHAVWKKRPV